MNNDELFKRAQKTIPGGVNSPVRAFGKVGGTPRFITRAQGAHMYDAEGREYIDHVISWGPMIIGHAHPRVVETVMRQAERGMSYGAPTEMEIVMAETVSEAFASIDKVRFVNSGTEATMSAIRLARAFTGRDMIIKFEGCYHGHVDSLLAKAGSGALTFGVPDTAGVPDGIAQTTLVLNYNDVESFAAMMKKFGSEVAAVIVEPVAGNMGMVPPADGFLETLRKETEDHGSLLIFDEVITGFRFCYGGYQDLVGIRPDLTCLGKIIGGGMPVGAFGGRRDIMDMLAPEGPVYQAGTLAGNPMAMAAGLATLNVLKEENPYAAMAARMESFVAGLAEAACEAGVPLTVNYRGSMAGIFFTEETVACFDDVMQASAETYKTFFHSMLDNGVYLAPSPFEAFFLSSAHDDAVMGKTLAAAVKSIKAL